MTNKNDLKTMNTSIINKIENARLMLNALEAGFKGKMIIAEKNITKDNQNPEDITTILINDYNKSVMHTINLIKEILKI